MTDSTLRIEQEVLAEIQADAQAAREAGLLGLPRQKLPPKWRALVSKEPGRLFRQDGSIDPQAFRQFRRLRIFIPDAPTFYINRLDPRNLIGGGRRGIRHTLDECLEVIRTSPTAEALLRKYPCTPVGQPFVYRRMGHAVTYRWLKHIWCQSVLRDTLGDGLKAGDLVLDIGSSYGIFSGLVSQEWPGTHHILADFSEQLLLARYFLKMWMPKARIAGIREVLQETTLNRKWLSQYDFVLLPCPKFSMLEPDAADLVFNCASFGEMTRDWFNFYMQSAPVQNARILFLVNRIQSWPTYKTDLTIADYPICAEDRRRLHFGVCPIFSNPYLYHRKALFFTEKIANNPYFEYIGERTATGKTLPMTPGAAVQTTHPS